jgi:predicted RNA binding protein YcfA (HicA-like mRNA interferase family)
MSIKPVKTKLFEKWLKKRGLVYKRTKGSHDVWDYPDDSLLRPIVFRGAKPEIPGCHIHTNLDTLGVEYKDFLKEIANL